MLDEVGRRIQHPRDQPLALRQRHLLEQLPFVPEPGIGSLERQGAGPGLESKLDNLLERRVEVMRSFVIAPAQVHPQLVHRDVAQGVVEGLHVQRSLAIQVGLVVAQAIPATHGQVRTVDLQNETGAMDGVVFGLHRVGQRGEIGLLGGVVLVPAEVGDQSG